MSDPISIASSYLDAWNETDSKRRVALMRKGWADDVSYIDPLMGAQGIEQVGELIERVQQRFPGFRFALIGHPNGHGDHVRFSWSLGPAGSEAPIEGSDVVGLRQGRIASVVGFLDKVPAAA